MTLRPRNSLTLALLLAIAVLPSDGTTGQREPGTQRLASETYAAVKVDVEGRLVITTSDSRTVVVPKEKEQTSFSVPVISASRTAVGAQAMFGNCCTSHDIPLQLVVYRSGRVHRFTGIDLPIWLWHFTDADRRVAFGQSEVHSACRTHYELRDIDSQRLLESVDVPRACGQIPNPAVTTVPKWVGELESAWAACVR